MANPNPPRPTISIRPGLTPIGPLPPIRPGHSLQDHHVSVGRPSQNLGHIFNSNAIQHSIGLAKHIGMTNPMPFGLIPKAVKKPLSPNYGMRVRSAIQALQHPTHAGTGSGEKPTVAFGQRVSSAIRTVRDTYGKSSRPLP